MESYGQVYWGCYKDGEGWRGILMDEKHAEVWVGLRCLNPDDAFAAMEKEAPGYGITDLRRWSGIVEPGMIARIKRDDEIRKKREAELAAKKAKKSAA